MTYASETAGISRTPVTLVKLTLDFCSNTYGVAPCTATGSSGNECYNTFPTCHDRTNYAKSSKVYKFSDFDAPQSSHAARPFLMSYDPMPTEIKDSITVKTRVKLKMADNSDDSDVGVDPYVANRTSVQGTFWKKFLARNPNYKGRELVVLQGYSAIDESNYQERFVGVLDNIEISKTAITIEAIDLLASLEDVEVPPKLDISLAVAMTDIVLEATLNDVADLETTGYMLIDDEIFYWGATDTTTNKISSLSRAQFGTTAAAHDVDAKCQVVQYYAPASPYVHLQTLLKTNGGIAAERIDDWVSWEFATDVDWADTYEWSTSAFDYYSQFPHTDITFSAIIVEPTKVSDLIKELTDLLYVKIFQNEAQKITVTKALQNEPGRLYSTITDDENILLGSGSVDFNEESRVTRVVVYWAHNVLGDLEDPKEYNAIDIAVDVDAEGVNEYNDEITDKLFCRWVRRGYLTDEAVDSYMEMLVCRRLFLKRDASAIIDYTVELKDEGIKTGQNIKLTTDEQQNTDGTSLTAVPCMVIKREPGGNKVKHRAIRLPDRRLCYIAPDSYGDTNNVAEAQTPVGAGNLTLANTPVKTSEARKLYIFSDDDDSGITFTVTGKSTTGAAQVSAATTGPNRDGVVVVDAGANHLYWTEVSQIAVSGVGTGNITAGFYLDYDDATAGNKEYGFMSETNEHMNANTIDHGYQIW